MPKGDRFSAPASPLRCLLRAVRFRHIRARRRHPGLAVRAAAALCWAMLDGGALASQDLLFVPRHPVNSGRHEFDLAAARERGSAGGRSRVLQTILLPLALAVGTQRGTATRGTHLTRSPSFDYIHDIWFHALRYLGTPPIGKGATRAEISGAPPRPRQPHTTEIAAARPSVAHQRARDLQMNALSCTCLMARSTVFNSISMRPSPRNAMRLDQCRIA